MNRPTITLSDLNHRDFRKVEPRHKPRDTVFVAAISISLAIAVLAVSLLGCSRQAPTDPNAFSAKTFWGEKERWSGGSDGGQ